MKNKIILLAIVLATIIYISSCSKEDMVDKSTTEVNKIDKQLIKNTSDILVFSDQDEFARQLVLINQMNSNELINFQDNNSYESFGLFCNTLYSEIAKDSLDPDLVIQNTEVYSDYIQLVPDNDESGYMSLFAKFENSPLYYIMNMDRMYIVGEMVYKVFEEGLLETEMSNFEELKDVDNYGDAEAIESIISIGAGASVGTGTGTGTGTGNGHDAGTYREEIKKNGKNRTMASIDVKLYATTPATQYGSCYFTKPQKRTLYLWFRSYRHITIDTKLAVDIHQNDGTVERKHFVYPNETKYGWSVGKPEVFFVPAPNLLKSVHYAGYDVYSSTPSAPAVTFSKYTNNL